MYHPLLILLSLVAMFALSLCVVWTAVTILRLEKRINALEKDRSISRSTPSPY